MPLSIRDPALLGLPAVFSTQPDKVLAKVIGSARVVPLKSGEPLLLEARNEGAVVIPRNGLMYKKAQPPSGSDVSIICEFIKPGQLIGIPPGRPHFYLMAAENCTVVYWPFQAFAEVLYTSPALAEWGGYQLHARIFAYASERLNHKVMSSEARVAHLYWSLAEPLEDGSRIMRFKLPQALVADYLGLSREEVNRRLKVLEKSGIILSKSTRGVTLDASTPSLFNLWTDAPALNPEHPLDTSFRTCATC